MKFLCVPCDKPMTLEQTQKDRSSISLTYACADCGYEMAMLTNPMETQVVGSLGVKIGPDGESQQAASKCPMTGMLEGMGEAGEGQAPMLPWTDDATARMSDVPEFVRPMVRSGIERFARERGHAQVDGSVLDEARSYLGMATSEEPAG